MVDLDSARCHGRQAIVLAGNRVCKKYRKRLWKRECRNLKAILPSVANKKVSDVEVIEEAVGYIEQLEQAIAQRLGVIACPQMIAALHMQHFMKVANQINPPVTPPITLGQQSQMPLFNQQTSQSLSAPQSHHPYGAHMQRKDKLATSLRV